MRHPVSLVLLLLAWCTRPSTQQTIYTYGGPACVFPFTYQGKSYSACTTDASYVGLEWCGIVSDVPDMVSPSTWGYCFGTQVPTGLPVIPTQGPSTPPAPNCNTVIYTTEGELCVFPFTYKDVTYPTCTTVSNDNVPWCSLDTNYDGDWGNCDLTICDGNGNTVAPTTPPAGPPGGPGSNTGCTVATTAGQACVLPFVYQNNVYDTCTMVNHDRYWCSLTSTYSGSWGNCALDRTEDGQQCVFPFEYRGETYNGCTHAYATFAWCSLDAVYDGNWGQCDLCPQ